MAARPAPTVIPREVAMRRAGQILANARARIARLSAEQAAREAYVPGGPSVEEIAAKIRAWRGETTAPARPARSARKSA